MTRFQTAQFVSVALSVIVAGAAWMATLAMPATAFAGPPAAPVALVEA